MKKIIKGLRVNLGMNELKVPLGTEVLSADATLSSRGVRVNCLMPEDNTDPRRVTLQVLCVAHGVPTEVPDDMAFLDTISRNSNCPTPVVHVFVKD